MTSIATPRLVACYAAILGTFPYLTLKLSWLTGHPIGLTDPSFVDTPLMRFANLLTAGMDAVAVLLAFALTYRWGRRVPAPLVLFPAWVATGLLAPIVLVSPVIGVDLLSPPSAELPLRTWVWAVVYGGFAWQGIALLTAFVFYVGDRWPWVRTGLFTPRPSWPVAGIAVATAFVHFAWAAGWTYHPMSLSGRVMDAVIGVLTLLAVAAASTSGPRWPRVVVIWTGAGAMFGWGSWLLFALLTTAPLGATGTLVQAVTYVAQIGTAVAFVLQPSRRGVTSPDSYASTTS